MSTPGVCPHCGSMNLVYGSIEPEGEMIYYPWTCEDCSHSDKEWYDIIFSEHTED